MEATRVTVDEVRERMERGEQFAFVDTRNPQAWGEAERAANYAHTRSMYSYADEISAIPVSIEQLRAAPMRLGDKPLIVLTR
jgi:hypothetical protein